MRALPASTKRHESAWLRTLPVIITHWQQQPANIDARRLRVMAAGELVRNESSTAASTAAKIILQSAAARQQEGQK